ncbi:hypothetical protein [Paragemmobacter aquarius]|uniref:hypothetical protein n=1 Tax=Paragemmobacter aquarius TaxID=2169400 RepID=UPI001C1FA4D1|nr:hypothetical protein [Gemmobacter aquarius]
MPQRKAGAGMGLIFGAGAAVMALWMVLRLLPKAVGLTVWLGTTGFTAATAAIVLYMLLGEPR